MAKHLGTVWDLSGTAGRLAQDRLQCLKGARMAGQSLSCLIRLGAIWRASSVGLALIAHPALAEGALVFSDGPDGNLISPSPAEASGAPPARVFIAANVGSVTVGSPDAGGARAYAARIELAGTASQVGFSATPLVARSNFGPSSSPLSAARLTSVFGARRSAASGGVRAHAGVDLAAPIGAPVAATGDGRVLVANWSGDYGLLVTVDHGNGLQTRYAHLSSLNVVPGQHVAKGQTIGLVGSTGHSTGPHLHYEIRQSGRPVNPLGRR